MFPRHLTALVFIVITTASCGSNPTNGETDSTGTAGATTGSHFDAAGVTGLGSGGGSTVGMPEGGDARSDATTGSRIDASTTSASPDANSTSGGDATTTSGSSQTSTTTAGTIGTTTGTVATTGSQTTGVGATTTSGGVTTTGTSGGTQTTTSGTTGTSTVTSGGTQTTTSTTGRTTTTGSNPMTTTGSGTSSGQTTTSGTISTTGSTTTGSATTTSGNTTNSTTSTTGVASTTSSTTGSTTTSTTGVGTTGSATTTSGVTTGSTTGSTTTGVTTGSTTTGVTTGSTTGNPPVCSANTTRCSGPVLQTCAGDGSGWNFTSTCPFVCSGGACIGVCVPNSIRCNNLDVQTCDGNGAWNTTSTCTAPPNSTASCTGNGICGSSCNGGFADCTGAAGCETTLGTVANCTTCNNTCTASAAHMSPTCTGSCGTSCDSGWKDCNGNLSDGCEKDSLNDVSNCGTCGNVCNGGICDNGACKAPASIHPYLAANHPYLLSVDGSSLYVASYTTGPSTITITKMNLDGTSSTNIFDHAGNITALKAVGGVPYYSDGVNIYKINGSGLSTQNPVPVVNNNFTSNFVTDSTRSNLFWVNSLGAGCFCTNSTGNTIYKMPLTIPLTPVVYLSKPGNEIAPSFALSGAYTYSLVLIYSPSGSPQYETDITQVNQSSGSSVSTAVRGKINGMDSDVFIQGIAMAGNSTQVFSYIDNNIWSASNSGVMSGASNVAMFPVNLSGSSPTGGAVGQAMLADDTSVYFSYLRIPAGGGSPKVFFPYAPISMDQDSTYVYFTSSAYWPTPPYSTATVMTATNGVFRVTK